MSAQPAATDLTTLPAGLPAPVDDGAADHLRGMSVAQIELPSTLGGVVNLAGLAASPCVLFFYPRTGVPGRAAPALRDGTPWDSVPGMRGCTPQSCGFRDLSPEFGELGVGIAAVSTQDAAYQLEFARRMELPFPVLSDSELRLTQTMSLPQIEMPIETGGPSTLIRRMAWYCDGGRIEHVWYPVFPPDENAQRVLEWLRRRAHARSA